MGLPLRTLIVEDSEDDTCLLLEELRRGGYDPIYERVETAEAMKAALQERKWDIILADHSLPRFSGLEALSLLKESGLDLPLIIVSGPIGELLAATVIKAGANDYLMKHNLSHLCHAVEQELREAETRRRFKQSEKAFRETKQILEAIVETAPSLIFLTNQEGRILFFNHACEELTGYASEEVLGKKVSEFFGPQEWMPDVQRRMADPYNPEVRVLQESLWITKSGEERLIEWRRTILFFPQDSRPYMLATGVDVTERKQAEEALRESEQRFRELYDNAPVGYFEYNVHGCITSANRTELEMLGYSLEEMIGQPVWKFIVEEETARQQILAKLAGTMPPARGLVRTYRRKDGTTIAVLIEDRLLRNPEGKIIGIRSTIQDVSERKRAEETLRENERKYRTLIENIPQKIFLKDKDSVYISCNANYALDLKIKPDEIIGKTDYDFYPKELANQYRADDKRIIESGRAEDIEERYLQNGKELFVHTLKTPIKDGKGNTVGLLGVFWDITDRKKAEGEMAVLQEQFRQSQKMEAVGRLVGGIAHDFNNLLTVIRGYCQLSLLEKREGDPMRENLEEMKNASEKAARLIRQLMVFSRHQIMEMKSVDLNTLLLNLDRMLRRVIGEDIKLVTVLAQHGAWIKGDPGQIEQVIMNLVVNARDAMPKGGKLIVETANATLRGEDVKRFIHMNPGRYVVLSVSDTGVGMKPEVKEKIFEPFFTTKEKGKGTGLGLSTVYGIVEQTGGNIRVLSEPGKGTTFKIYFPREEGPLDQSAEEKKVDLPRGTETILVVEDEADVRKVATRILVGQGYKVLEASDGYETLRLCEGLKEPLHLILTDLVMPGMNGHELVSFLERLHPSMKVLYMSGYSNSDIPNLDDLKKGMNYIQKPFAMEDLVRKVREVLDS